MRVPRCSIPDMLENARHKLTRRVRATLLISARKSRFFDSLHSLGMAQSFLISPTHQNVRMKKVNITALRKNLNAHLRLVRLGEEIIVVSRSVPIARISPFRPARISEEEREL